MNIGRAEREELNILSAYVFGTSSKWQKIMRQCLNNGEYKQYRVSSGFSVDASKTKKLGKDYRVTSYRSPTINEMRLTMSKLKDEKDFDGLSPIEAIDLSIDKYLEGTIDDLNLRLIVPVAQAEDFVKLLGKLEKILPPDAEALGNITDAEPQGGFRYVDGIQFAENLIERHDCDQL